jgi:hypothetical protein
VGPTLRPYQLEAVRWMLYREGALADEDSELTTTKKVNLKDAFFDKMYVPISIDGQQAFYNPYIGYLCWTVPKVGQTLPSGGILAGTT